MQCLLRVKRRQANSSWYQIPVLAKSKRRLCKNQLFVIKPTRHRTSEPQSEAYFSPSRAVISRDFQGAICKKEPYLIRKINVDVPSIGSRWQRSKPDTSPQNFLCSAYTSPQLVAIEKTQKGQAFWKILKDFYNPPSLIQGNSEGSCTTKKRTVYKLFTSFPLLYLPF